MPIAQKLMRRGQRLLTDLQGRLRSFARAPLTQPIFFMHLEKCGGTSIAEAIRQTYVDRGRRRADRFAKLDPAASLAAARRQGQPVMAYREQLLYYLLSKNDVSFVTGHFQVSSDVLEAFEEDWAFVVVLRDPVQRWLSHYFYNRYKDTGHQEIDLPIDAYLDTPRGRALGQDYVTLLIGQGDYGPDVPAPPSAEAIQRAKDVLDRFDVVGHLENMSGFQAAFEETFGTALRIAHRNVNPASEKKKNVGEGTREKIQEICAPNAAIYQHVLQ